MQLDEQAIAADESLPARAAAASRDAGVITRAIAGGALQASPPFIITRDQLDELAQGLLTGIERVA